MPRVIRFVLAAIALPLAALAGFAADPPKPNTLTPKEIADGWLLLFDGETSYGWVVRGKAEVKDGALVLGAGEKTVAYPTTHFGAAFEMEMEVSGTGRVLTRESEGTFQGAAGRWGRLTANQYAKGAGMGIVGPLGKTTSGVTSDRKELAAAPLLIETDGTTTASIRSVKIRPIDTKSLFNGKDLTGWKVFADPKRSASKWSVTKDGEIHVANGPGDLQTDGKYGDFVLQFECKTNGTGLNSGIFFRCIADQYQNGYEAQINNAMIDGDRLKPKDAGTGAIYRRIPARRIVANDGEWFTMTLAAHGKHFATWVNGVQTVDWIDDRADDENPRKGARTAAGHLSIQGHDPTTDILFRNLRIRETGK